MSAALIHRPKAVVIGCSTGALQALTTILAALDASLPVSVIIVCHTGADDVDLLCELLQRVCPLPVQEAAERHRPEPGIVYVAPSGYHLQLEPDGRFTLTVDPKVCYVRPSVDVLFESAADFYRTRLVGVILTGANEDGAAGLAQVRRKGGFGIVQDPAGAEAPQMPAAALKLAGADQILQLPEIAGKINELCS